VVRSDFVLVSEKNRIQVQTMEDRICLKNAPLNETRRKPGCNVSY
jgi:hypothetical protein